MSIERIEAELRRVLKPEAADGATCPATGLYRYAAGEATPEEANSFRQHLASCAECRADLETFERLPVEPVPATESFGAWLRRWLTAGPLVPAGAAVFALLIAVVWWTRPPEEDPPDSYRIKGGYKLHVAVQRGQERFTGISGSQLQLEDTLGFFYTAPAQTYLTVLVADEEGTLAQAFPQGDPQRLPAGVEQRLPSGAVVGKGTSCEWVVAFFSAERPQVAALRSELAAAVARRSPDCALPPLGGPATTDVFLIRRPAP